jgi:hypothetical protein
VQFPETRTHVPKLDYHRCWKLTGYDGKVVLVDETGMSLWELSIEGCEEPSWSRTTCFIYQMPKGNFQLKRASDAGDAVVFFHIRTRLSDKKGASIP